MTNYLATTSEHMAQFQYVWHNIWANVLLKFKTTKLFKHALKVIPEKPINLRKQNHIFEVHTKKTAIENLLIAYIGNWSKYMKLKE